MTLEYVLALFVLMLISMGVFFFAGRIKVPYTVLLVLVGSLLVPLSSVPGFRFLGEFQLTPELLFYIFLPILIFESAYNMRIRELQENIRSVSWFAVGSLILSTFFVAGGLFFALRLIGLEVPFLVTLLFGALISATDPVAVLALFKEFGVPRRLSFIFEGESLFNDGTSLAAFLIVLEVVLKGFSGTGTVLEGVFMFTTMVAGGVAFGILMGFLFAKLIEKAEGNEHVEITLTLLVAHLTFILSEVLSHHLVIAGQEIKFSSIIATVMASMVIGNYGRSKLSVKTAHFMERFWGYFAFVANSLVFITMGLLFASLPIDFVPFVAPILLAVFVVMVGRAVSIYPVAAWLNFSGKEKRIPTAWQHLLAWGSLRGALAVTMVLLIPDDLVLPGWQYDFTIKEFITAITIGCIYFTLFVKATTIGSMIKRYRLDALTPTERAEYHQSRTFIFSYALEKIGGFLEKGYVPATVHDRLERELMTKRDGEYAACEKMLGRRSEDFEQALRIYALGIERYILRMLYRFDEVSESVYKRILTKLEVQQERVEEGTPQVRSLDEHFTPDWFEQMTGFVRSRLFHPSAEESLRERYMYYRAQEIMARKAVKELGKLKHRSRLESEMYCRVLDETVAAYQAFHDDARKRTAELVAGNGTVLREIDQEFGQRSVKKALAEGLNELTRKEMLPSKLAVLLEDEFAG